MVYDFSNNFPMKKIGILTLPLHHNYGGILQAITLYEFLESKGFNVVSLRNDFFISSPAWKKLARWFLKHIPFQNVKNIRYLYKKNKFHESFIAERLRVRTPVISDRSCLIRVATEEKFDVIIVGSDQVWRWDYIRDDYARYFLDFVDSKQVMKISYAASFGKSQWHAPELKCEISRLLAGFHAVSVREIDGVDTCKNFGILNCHHVLDPTLLVGRDFYDSFISKKCVKKNKKTLLSYILDEEVGKNEFIGKTVGLLDSSYCLESIGLNSTLSVPEWVNSFRQADFIVTDSFHGMVFSIIFNKPFVAVSNQARGGARFVSLLGLLGLSDRLIETSDFSVEKIGNMVASDIDYCLVNERLEILRRESESFLFDAISN